MLHLPTDRLAALADTDASGAEAAHLAQCAQCARERAAHRALLRLANTEIHDPAPPLTDWATLSARLAEEGLLRRSAAPSARWQPGGSTRWLRAAAAAFLLASGIGIGRLTAIPGGASVAGAALDTLGTAASLVADTLSFRSPAQALAALGFYERAYQQAAAYLAEHDSSTLSLGEPEAYRTRLATLDQVAATTREALHQAPYDPVINRYYLTTLGAREATLRQLSTSLPAGVRVGSY